MRRLLPVVVVIGSFVAFLPALDGEFLDWDDQTNLVHNGGYRGTGWPQVRWAFTSTLMGHYIPLTWLTFMANHAAGGLDPWGYHLGNLLLHSGNALLFYFVARRLLAAATDRGHQPSRPDAAIALGATAAALVFAVHPLRVESVAWVTERRDVLSGLFFLLAVLGYLRAVQVPGPTDRRWLAVSLTSFAAGLLSKSSVMVLPAVLVLLDAYPLRRGAFTWTRLFREKAGYWILGLAGAVGALIALHLSGTRMTTYGAYGPGARVAMVAYSLWFYPAAWVWPVELSPLYELPPQVDPLAWRFLGPLAGFVIVTVGLVMMRRRWPAGLAAWLYSALVLLPTSGVVHAGHQLAHDRYSYLSGLGFPLLVGGGIAWAMRAAAAGRIGRPVQIAVMGAAALVVATLGAGSWQQSRIWRSSESLWRWAVQVDPECNVCANNLAALIVRKPAHGPSEIQEAEALVRGAISLNPSYDNLHITLGAILALQQQDEAAAGAFREAIRLAPDHVAATANLGALHARNGRYREALPLLRKAYTRDPNFLDLRTVLGRALRDFGIEQARSGRIAEGTALLQEAAGVIPDDVLVHRSLGLALWEQRKPDEAGRHLERALALKADDDSLRRLLARLRAEPDRPPSKR